MYTCRSKPRTHRVVLLQLLVSGEAEHGLGRLLQPRTQLLAQRLVLRVRHQQPVVVLWFRVMGVDWLASVSHLYHA